MKQLLNLPDRAVALFSAGVFAVLLSSCSGVRGPMPRPVVTAPPEPAEVVVAKPATRPTVTPAPLPEPPPRPARPANSTVLALLSDARTLADSGNLAAAAANLERAIRIDPRNAQLWNRLAHVRLKQKKYSLAASLAAKSNSLAAGDSTLLNDNLAIIEQARGGR
ncbi:MAG TPA: tetratricopeptide repeat protein [Gammaproteobacteria bacterium]|nr:tetratricopeptide repeat protein [Gammaproteobacteria bacterium]